jgi:hypothetical protein
VASEIEGSWAKGNVCLLWDFEYICIFISFLAVLGFELSALQLLARCSTT